jgi:hypothetical protein
MMARPHGLNLLTGVAAGLCVAPLQTCAFPADISENIEVRIDAPSSTVVRGETLLLRATAISTSSSALPTEVSFGWSSSDETVATVSSEQEGSATLNAINTGRVTIRAVARDYRNARVGEREIRVANTVTIDSVVPDTVRYGEQVTIYGIGLGRVGQVILSETALITDTASFLGDPLGEGSQRYWVPYPARTARVLAVAPGGFSAPAAKPTVVLPTNAFTRNDGGPAILDLDGPPLLSDGSLFYNPALALTPGVNGDLFELARTDTTRPLTLVVSTSNAIIRDLEPSLFVPEEFSPEPFEDVKWLVGTSTQVCHGASLVTAPDLDFGSNPTTVARTLQYTFRAGVLLRISGASPGRYSLRILDGYRPPDHRLTSDRFEENDFCDGADLNAADSTKRVDPVSGFIEVVSIDQTIDVDWFRFTLPGDFDGTQLLTIRTIAMPFGAADSSNLGLGLISIDSLFNFEPDWTAQSHQPGSNERITAELPNGDYYLAVADESGVPTRYGLCISIGNDCELPVEPSAINTRTPP